MKSFKIVGFLLLFIGLITPVSAGTNLLLNPSFETGTTLADSWSQYRETAGTPTYSLSTTNVIDGAKSQRIQYTGQAGDTNSLLLVYQQPIACAPDDTLNLSAYIRGTVENADVAMTIDSYTTGGVSIDAKSVTVEMENLEPGKFQVGYKMPAETDHARVAFVVTGINANTVIDLNIDNAELYKNTPIASYSTDLRSGTSHRAPLTVAFTDTSSFGPTAWHWDFGDGSTSDSKNPSHTFTTAGAFNVVETVTKDGESTSYSKYVFATDTSNLLQNPNFEYNSPIASPWDSEYVWIEHDAIYHIVPSIIGDSGHAQQMIWDSWETEPAQTKVEIFQSVYGTTPEENLTFTIWAKGDQGDASAIIGIETFTGFGDPGAGGRTWIAERDIPIHITEELQPYTASFKMPAGTDSCAVYVQFNNMKSGTSHINVYFDNASLVDNDAAPIIEPAPTEGAKTSTAETASNTVVSVMAIVGAITLVFAAGLLIRAVKGDLDTKALTGAVLGIIVLISISVTVCIAISFMLDII